MDVTSRSSGTFNCTWFLGDDLQIASFPASVLYEVTLSDIEEPGKVVNLAEAGKGK